PIFGPSTTLGVTRLCGLPRARHAVPICGLPRARHAVPICGLPRARHAVPICGLPRARHAVPSRVVEVGGSNRRP
ncbi:MAG: hypothetical protein KJ594_00545, partial [Candidatus Omnitrophica bacterium]|nr:hypothetical protein [Candidatus Omnitrophota bacterium]